jgi:hypothetical protein
LKQAKCITKLKKLIKTLHPEINLVDMNIPLTNGKPTPKLRDILETDVDEKYYLRNDVVEKIVKEANFQERLVSLKSPKKQKEEPSELLSSGPVNIEHAGKMLKRSKK